jgi:hypothetical protein
MTQTFTVPVIKASGSLDADSKSATALFLQKSDSHPLQNVGAKVKMQTE